MKIPGRKQDKSKGIKSSFHLGLSESGAKGALRNKHLLFRAPRKKEESGNISVKRKKIGEKWVVKRNRSPLHFRKKKFKGERTSAHHTGEGKVKPRNRRTLDRAERKMVRKGNGRAQGGVCKKKKGRIKEEIESAQVL